MEKTMDHNKYKEYLHLSFIGEIGEEQKNELKRHLIECSECRDELESYRKIDEYLSEARKKKVSDEFLYDARTELRTRLRIERSKGNTLSNLIYNFTSFFSSNWKYVSYGAAGAAAGILVGFLLFKGPAVGGTNPQLITAGNTYPEEAANISNIRLIDPDPTDDQVELSFDAVKQVRVSGSISDEKIRSVLMYAMMNGNNPGIRLNSLNLLNSSSGTPYDSEIKEAITSAVKYDDNPGVRREALKVLKNFTFDQDVKRSYIYVILNDTSSAMRIEAINGLVEAGRNGMVLSEEEQKIFRERLLQDENSYIQLRARTVLEEYN
jgi:hypothetical protein